MLNCFKRYFAKVITKRQVFFDTTTLRVSGGTGGRGVSSFQMIQPGKFTPTGGNGGRGGNVFIRVNSCMDALTIPKTVYTAEGGKNGKGKCMHGRSGQDMFIDVPIGTLIYKLTENLDYTNMVEQSSIRFQEGKSEFEQQMRDHLGDRYEEIKENELESVDVEPTKDVLIPAVTEINRELLFDTSFSDHFSVFCLARGGKGGEGNKDWYDRNKRMNMRYWGSNRDRSLQASYYTHDEGHNKGDEGERLSILLQLQQLAEVGLVGYPNAGKSTLLSKLSKTIPKIAAYPFTTLRPLVEGYIKYSDDSIISVADIPGIIAGAHENRGLGLSFLRHVQRTKVLAYVIDVSDTENRPNLVYRELQKELLHYDENLLRKPSLIVANKIDEESSEEGMRLLRECTQLPIVPISAKCDINLEEVASMIRQACLIAKPVF